MWKWVHALVAGIASTAIAAFGGAFQTVDPAGLVGTNPVKVAVWGLVSAAVVRAAGFLVAKLG